MKPTHKRYGHSVDDSIEGFIKELQRDAVGLWEIFAEGRRGFDLEGDKLQDFVRAHILALLKSGAKLVRGLQAGDAYWKVIDSYGDEPQSVAEAIVKEWPASRSDPSLGDGPWFALPRTYEQKRP